MGSTPNTPNLLIVGAAKSGTTALYKILSQHPDVYFPSVKEPHFLSELNTDISINDIEDYLNLYRMTSHDVRGDASVSYMPYYDKVLNNVKMLGMSPKIIILVRNPVHRFLSHYQYYKKIGVESRRIEEVLDHSATVKNDPWRAEFNPYYQCGLYYDAILAYQSCCDVLVVKADDLKNNQQSTVDTITGFLGISNMKLSVDVTTNVSGEVRYGWTKSLFESAFFMNKIIYKLPESLKERLRSTFLKTVEQDESIIKRLNEFYACDMQKTQELTGIALSGVNVDES